MQLILIIRPAGWTATKVTKATKAAREIVFFLNGKEVGVAASSLGTEELQACSSPSYMGGVALLTKFDVNRDTMNASGGYARKKCAP